jgi:HNH endonuclease/AP2 domain
MCGVIEMKTEIINGHEVMWSDEDHAIVTSYKWGAHSYKKNDGPDRFYVSSKVDGKTVYLHRLLTNAPKGIDVDHINGNGLDNRRENLRLASRSQNAANKPSYNGSSIYKGVCRAPTKSPRWRAWFMVNKKSVYLGSFKTELEAARAYNLAAEKIWGEYAHLNAA